MYTLEAYRRGVLAVGPFKLWTHVFWAHAALVERVVHPGPVFLATQPHSGAVEARGSPTHRSQTAASAARRPLLPSCTSPDRAAHGASCSRALDPQAYHIRHVLGAAAATRFTRHAGLDFRLARLRQQVEWG